jgi:hypothetical protein
MLGWSFGPGLKISAVSGTFPGFKASGTFPGFKASGTFPGFGASGTFATADDDPEMNFVKFRIKLQKLKTITDLSLYIKSYCFVK